MQESFRVSAPGKLFLLGEHAVLRGRRALVCAVDQRMYLDFSKRNDSKIHIKSDLGEYNSSLEMLSDHPKFRFVLEAIRQFGQKLEFGFDLLITTDFSDQVGLGSSAAVTAAMLGGICQLTGKEIIKREIFDQGLKVIHTVQGTGSGADLAASVFGGVASYRMVPLELESLNEIFPITVIYSGSKLPTVKVIDIVNKGCNAQPELYKSIFDLMDTSVERAVQAIKRQDWKSFGEILNVNQGLMDAIGVSNKLLAEINCAFRSEDGILGSKISGSGLGDCVVAVGTGKPTGYQTLPLSISREGLRVEYI